MNDAPKHICSTCGRALRSNAPEQLCAACSMTAALEEVDLPAELPSDSSGDLASTNPHLIQMPDTEGFEKVAVDARDVEAPTPDSPREFGGYRLVNVLGQGGMGVVYEAEQVSTGRRVALKMLGSRLDSPEMRRRFLREGRLAAGISHPNSVYVFGTEEIEGLPVITMEIAGGGTLQDKLDSRGKFPIVEAVDAMLDVVDGLEAALASDVLHRDIKPSNCFVDPDGRVKVGDFGMSVSMIAGVDTFATQTGMALGTPAFASPEQLRGDELDCRTDIYAIGSTLYTLLIGEPPFNGNNAVQVVAAVLDETPPRLDSLQPDVPAGLAASVAKCLAKKSEARYTDYAALRAALLPFSSRLPLPEPAPLVRRTLAGIIDLMVGWQLTRTALASTVGILHIGELSAGPTFWGLTVVSMILYFAYIGLTEGSQGSTVGKWLLGLRVRDQRGRKIGYAKSFIRAAVALAFLQTYLVLKLVVEAGWLGDDWPEFVWGALFMGAPVVGLLLPLVTMRKRNQFATAWDIVSNSRVMMATPATVASKVTNKNITQFDVDNKQRIGPYAITRTIIEDQWIEAIDDALGRAVWLRRRLTPELSNERRDVARSTRPRWLQSVHTEDGIWDAYEATTGTSLPLYLAAQKKQESVGVHWRIVRRWLYDLSLELASADGDQTLPAKLSLGHVWVAKSGRAILLDRPLMVDGSLAPVIDVRETSGQQAFLSLVADCAAANTIPVRAKDTLKNIAAGTFDRISFLAGNMRSLLTKPAVLDRGGRATAILTLPLFLIGGASLYEQTTHQTYQTASARWSEAYQDIPPLSDVLRYRDAIEESESESASEAAIRIHLAGHYAGLRDALNYKTDQSAIVATLGDYYSRAFLQMVVNTPPEFTLEELHRADRHVARALQESRSAANSNRWRQYFLFTISVLVAIAGAGLIATLLFGRTLGQIVFAYAAVTVDGAFAGRMRLLGRWLITWSPIILVAYIGNPTIPAMLVLVPWLIGVGIAIANPQRGLAERWTGTWLVPR